MSFKSSMASLFVGGATLLFGCAAFAKVPLPAVGTNTLVDCSYGVIRSTITKVEGDTATFEGESRGKPMSGVRKSWQLVTPNLYDMRTMGGVERRYEIVSGSPKKIGDLEIGSTHKMTYDRYIDGSYKGQYNFSYKILEKKLVDTKHLGPQEVYSGFEG